MGLTVLDAGVIIGVLDADDAHHDAARRALAKAIEAGDALAVPASVYAEVLVAPAGVGVAAVRRVDALLNDLAVDVEPATRQLAKRAAELRARHGRRLRLPDALVLATAVHLRADQVLTVDRGWPDAGVRVVVVGRKD
ncbi:MAG TPA: PIN domain-containing protein [Candidatus Limnocylindria bacterium]